MAEIDRTNPGTPLTATAGGSQRTGFLGAARTRILLCYIGILAFIFAIGIPIFRHFLFARVDRRVQDDMSEKMAFFRSSLAEELIDEDLDNSGLSAAQSDNRQQRLKKPANSAELEDFLDAFLTRQLPEDEVYMIAFVKGQLYKSSPRARPEVLEQNSDLMQAWAKATVASQGTQKTKDLGVGDILYLVEPVKVNDRTLGVFVVAHTTSGERNEVLEAVVVVVQVFGGVLVLALVLIWFASGQVLAPLRSLIGTARLVGESDLSQRLPVQGGGEMAEIATTFNEMMERLESAFVSQRNFINDAGHELRTPITIIRGHLELMGDDPQEREEAVAIAIDELDRMARMVEDLMLLAKSERPDFLQYEIVDVRTFTEELFAKLRSLGNRNWDLAKVAEGEVRIDRYRLTQAILNLANNAMQHTQVGDKISFGSMLRQKMLHLWIQDTGEGIADTDREQIFERFARAAKSRRRSEGSGLGLAIVKAIVDAHRGQISLQSQLQCGSTFTLKIPLFPAADVLDATQNVDR
ncbi:HAMP domain-containing sensor histidine kinase [Chamaesiphon sp. OTE_8_metabat_110]|uniref:sensor histidine kinase n=1 Tax=Chamaesiphon sp. OTE_8_metabat_110 TaxID=2964696 RepID=UPI00286B61D4|nr:HAMP domain-containing sensor histidine kinase [Chamaesiphon sp. OTE_8_metabat_110]